MCLGSLSATSLSIPFSVFVTLLSPLYHRPPAPPPLPLRLRFRLLPPSPLCLSGYLVLVLSLPHLPCLYALHPFLPYFFIFSQVGLPLAVSDKASLEVKRTISCEKAKEGGGRRAALRRLARQPPGSRRRPPTSPQASRHIPKISHCPLALPKPLYGSVPCACVLVSPLVLINYKPYVCMYVKIRRHQQTRVHAHTGPIINRLCVTSNNNTYARKTATGGYGVWRRTACSRLRRLATVVPACYQRKITIYFSQAGQTLDGRESQSKLLHPVYNTKGTRRVHTHNQSSQIKVNGRPRRQTVDRQRRITHTRTRATRAAAQQRCSTAQTRKQ